MLSARKLVAGTVLTSQEALSLYTAQLVVQGQAEVFGKRPTQPLRTGNKVLRKALAGPQLLKAYPLYNRLSMAMPIVRFEKGFMQFFKRVENISDELFGGENVPYGPLLRPDVQASPKDKALLKAMPPLASEEEIKAESEKKKIEDLETENAKRVEFIKYQKEEVALASANGKRVNRELVEEQVVLKHYMKPEDVLVTDADGVVKVETNFKVKKGEKEGMKALKPILEGYAVDPTAPFEFDENDVYKEAKKPELPVSILLEHALLRALEKVNPSKENSNQNSVVAGVMNKLNIAPELNLSRLLYAPKFFLSSSDEQYMFSPQSRPIIASQLADECIAAERRKMLLKKHLDIAPFEINDFVEYCRSTTKQMFDMFSLSFFSVRYEGNPEKAAKFASALSKLSNPDICLALGEIEIEQEKAPKMLRLVVSTGATKKIVADTDPVFLEKRKSEIARVEESVRTSKLLSFQTTPESMLKTSKLRDSADINVTNLLARFHEGSFKEMTLEDKQIVFDALIRILEEEESMYEAMEVSEMPLSEQKKVSKLELEQALVDLKAGSRVNDDVWWKEFPASSRLEWTRKLLEKSSSDLEKLSLNLSELCATNSKLMLLKFGVRSAGEDVAVFKSIVKELNVVHYDQLKPCIEKLTSWLKTNIAVDSVNDVADFLFQSALLNGVTDAYYLLNFLRIIAERECNNLPELIVSGYHFHLVAQNAKFESDEAWILSASKSHCNDKKSETIYYVPFHPLRRNLIALRHRISNADDIDAKLQLIYNRHVQFVEEIQAKNIAKTIDGRSVFESASMDFWRRTWSPKGGYQSPKEIRTETQNMVLKRLNKFKAAKKGQGKRAMKKKK